MTTVTSTEVGRTRMLRRVIAGTSAGLLLAAGLVGSSAAQADYEPWGATSAANQVLKPSCAHYVYRYRVQPPVNDWAAELFLIGPEGGKIASAALDVNSDPAVGREHWRLCRPSLMPGRYQIRMKITWLDGYDKYEGFVKPSYFRLQRQR
jgi:hypothetical protein